jgi:HD-GYP domain-containing protein (c-di-GMP phosphodiesterase class II)
MDTSEAHLVGLAGRLHDIGEIAVPDALLEKNTPLTEGEEELIHKHPAVGASVVSRVPALRALAPLIRGHHERWDGQGYPDGLAATAIPLGARVLAVADAFRALTAERAFRRAVDPPAALGEIRRGAGTQFDPNVVRALERVVLQAGTMLTDSAGVA